MSICIRGIKAPKNCHECDALGISDLVGINCPCLKNDCYDFEQRPSDCPISEIN